MPREPRHGVFKAPSVRWIISYPRTGLRGVGMTTKTKGGKPPEKPDVDKIREEFDMDPVPLKEKRRRG